MIRTLWHHHWAARRHYALSLLSMCLSDMGDIIHAHVLQTSKGEVLSLLPRLNTRSCQSFTVQWRDDCYDYSVLTSVVCTSLFPGDGSECPVASRGAFPLPWGVRRFTPLPAVTLWERGFTASVSACVIPCFHVRPAAVVVCFPRTTMGWKKLPDYLSKFAANCATKGCRRSLCLDEKRSEIREENTTERALKAFK